jgi:hypothetical protein
MARFFPVVASTALAEHLAKTAEAFNLFNLVQQVGPIAPATSYDSWMKERCQQPPVRA